MPTLPVFNLCNNRCWMCTNPGRYALFGRRHFKAANILGRLKRFREGEDEFLENYPDVFSLTGGEPTLSPDLLPVMNHIRRMFPRSRVVCLTNGRMFAYPSFAKKILSVRGDLELVVPIHGSTAAEHDAITRTRGSFEQTVRGLDNILKERRVGHLLEIRIVIHRMNYKRLKDVVRFVYRRWPRVDRIVLIFFEVEGQAVRHFKKVRLSYRELRPFLEPLHATLLKFREARLYHFPLCVIPPRFYPFVWRTLGPREVRFPDACVSCGMRPFCLGVHRGYLRCMGVSEFFPQKAVPGLKRGSNWHRPILSVRQSP